MQTYLLSISSEYALMACGTMFSGQNSSILSSRSSISSSSSSLMTRERLNLYPVLSECLEWKYMLVKMEGAANDEVERTRGEQREKTPRSVTAPNSGDDYSRISAKCKPKVQKFCQAKEICILMLTFEVSWYSMVPT